MDYTIPCIPYLTLTFHLQAEQDCFLPKYKGSMLRGAFGHALKNLVCSRSKNYECSECPQKETCIYTNVFEIFITNKAPPFLRGINSAPRPFVIDAFQVNEHYSRGQELKFKITLFGNVCSWNIPDQYGGIVTEIMGLIRRL